MNSVTLWLSGLADMRHTKNTLCELFDPPRPVVSNLWKLRILLKVWLSFLHECISAFLSFVSKVIQ